MSALDQIRKGLFARSEEHFDALALEVFHAQSVNNPVYHEYLSLLDADPKRVTHIEAIPFLPITFFKSQQVVSIKHRAEAVFESSGTTGQSRSRHYVADLSLYEQSIKKGFEFFYGNPGKYRFLALLPSYLERQHASLVHMAKFLMDLSTRPESGFYLDNHEQLLATLAKLESNGQPTILLGVTYALLQLAQKVDKTLQHTIIMETGGMKGHGPELTRMEVHEKLKAGFGAEAVHSEYGMTELLSQAYSRGNGRFEAPPWMKVICRDINDPFEVLPPGQSGMLQIIDLANLYSCSFIETEDLGRIHEDGTFEVLGRIDNSDVRGCNLMI